MSPVLVNPSRFATAVATGYAAEVLKDSPLWFAKMDETGTSTTMADSSGNGRNGSYVGFPTLGDPGLVSDGGTAVTFNGVNEYADVPGNTWMDIVDYTVEFVVKTTASNAYCINRWGSSVAVWGVFVRVAGTVGFTTHTGTTTQQVNGSTLVNDGTRHHIACVKSGTSMKIYFDGAVDGSGTFTNFDRSTSQEINLARLGNGTAFLAGTLDCPAFYGSALSATRIAAHAAAM